MFLEHLRLCSGGWETSCDHLHGPLYHVLPCTCVYMHIYNYVEAYMKMVISLV